MPRMPLKTIALLLAMLCFIGEQAALGQHTRRCQSCCCRCEKSSAPSTCSCGCCDNSYFDNCPPFDRYKKGFYQLWETEAAWIGSTDDYQQSEFNTFLRMAVPLDGTFDNILALQPGLRTFFLDGPQVVDAPAKLYDAQLNVLWRKELSQRWQSNIWMQPKVRSDYQETKDSFFLSGGAFAKYGWKPGLLELYLGAFYLDRDDISVLPAVGFVWTPNPSIKYEIVLPRPKLAHRIARGPNRETWVYLGGQLGGGSFAVERASGVADKLTLRDLRAYLGIEEVRAGGGGLFAELGYVFDRTIEYYDTDEEFHFNDAVMLRGGFRY